MCATTCGEVWPGLPDRRLTGNALALGVVTPPSAMFHFPAGRPDDAITISGPLSRTHLVRHSEHGLPCHRRAGLPITSANGKEKGPPYVGVRRQVMKGRRPITFSVSEFGRPRKINRRGYGVNHLFSHTRIGARFLCRGMEEDIDASGFSTATLLAEAPIADVKASEKRRKWIEQARDTERGGKQLPPTDLDWEILLYVAGRGFGKTIAQVEWAWWEAWRQKIIVHAIAPTLSDVRGTIFEGPAGFNATIPPECLLGGCLETAYNKTLHELKLSNGSLIRGFGAVEEAGRLRGPQCMALICDELREWDKPAGNLKLALNNALFGLRLPYPDGTPSRAVMGTTPKPIPFLKQFERRAGVRVIRGTSHENLKNLSRSYQSQLLSLAGTAMGRQEIDAVYIDDESDLSILKRHWVRLWPFDHANTDLKRRVHKPLPVLSLIVESYDTAQSEHNYDAKIQETDPTAWIVLGIFEVKGSFTDSERKRMGLRSRYAVLLLDCWSERLGMPALLEKARAQRLKKYGPRDRARKSDRVLIEDKSSGPALRQFMSQWTNMHVIPIKPRGNKAMRFHGISPLVFQGMLWVPESTRPDRAGEPIGWTNEFMDQICTYAGEGSVEHDDYVDALSGALGWLRDNGYLAATPEIEFIDQEDKRDHDMAEAKKFFAQEQRQTSGAPYG